MFRLSVRTDIKNFLTSLSIVLAAAVSATFCQAADYSNHALCSSGMIKPGAVPKVGAYSHFENSTSDETFDINSKLVILPKGCGLSPGAIRSIVGNVEGVSGSPYTVPTTPAPNDMLGNYELEALGTTKTVKPRSSDIVAANMAGRSDISKDQIGDLVTRARIGQMPDVELQVYGPAGLNALNIIGRLNTFLMLLKIASDTPTADELGDDFKYHFYLLY